MRILKVFLSSFKRYLQNFSFLNEIAMEIRIRQYPDLAPSGSNFIVEHRGKLLSLPSKIKYADTIGNYLKLDQGMSLLIDHLVIEGDTVLEIGAANGLHTMHLASRVGKRGKVHSFEPVKYNYDRLSLQVQLNRLENVVAHNGCVGIPNGLVTFYQPSENSGFSLNGSLVKNDKLSGELEGYLEEVTVTSVNLKEFVVSNNLCVNFIKMDVEGFEYEIINSSIDFFKEQKPILFMEYISKRLKHLNIDNQMFKELLSPIYDCYEVSFPYYNEYPVLDPFDFDREISSDILCLPKK